MSHYRSLCSHSPAIVVLFSSSISVGALCSLCRWSPFISSGSFHLPITIYKYMYMYFIYFFYLVILFAYFNYDCHHHYCHLYLWYFYISVCIFLSIAGLPVRCRASFGLRVFHHRRMVPACSDDIINVSL